ncbi:MAG: isochorismatase family protein [Bosea sp. (in: a-proteobacteria)]|uniref:isochorismatase family protein n=1 Tax=Bosea sp. (in: a-proteobacteria) TaxID=1871050 RepID=UPI0027331EF0|nr:isochorismatase family protein [Bosea sp. (in: a-proteobacteria)]MDP3257338.1 isochorismatase family protein [Bosea sp. (in: a-proteobacteria)]MDP3319872.1 isochorismatase family protein [Bosea sp. (in: a-proteobacteria)]
MPLLNASDSTLVIIDFQARLMPAIHEGAALVANAQRLVAAAGLLGVPIVMTEQNPAGLGGTVPELAGAGQLVTKMSFDACAEGAFLEALAGDGQIVLCGCEAHVCLGQTALTLLAHRRRVAVVQDASGSRRPESKDAALARLVRHGAEIVTTEMVIFEWLRNAEHPRFREALKLVK